MIKSCSFESSNVFHSFIIGFILRSFLFTQIVIVILTNKKDLLHLVLLLILLRCKAAFLLRRMSQWTQVAQGQMASWNVTTGQNFLQYFDHFQAQKQIDAKMKSTTIRRQTNCREFLIRSKHYEEESIIFITSVYQIPQTCVARRLAGKFYVTDHSSTQCFHVTRFSLWLAQVRSVQNNISK